MSAQRAQVVESQGGTGVGGARRDLSGLMRRLHTSNNIAIGILWVIVALVTLLFVGIIVLLLVQGAQYLIDPNFYSTGTAGVGQQIFNTFYILVLSELFLFPIALGAAIYTVEYAPPGRVVTAIRFAAETLAGVPSIVLGMFGVILFGSLLGFHISRITGALTLLCLNFPLALRLFEDAMLAVPREMREGSLALGSTRWHMIRTVVLPSALPGLITGLILSAGKIIGETAALVFTMGVANPGNVFTPDWGITSDTLTVHLWYVKTQGAGSTGLTTAQANAISAGSAALLILILLIINISARSIGRYIQHRVTAA